MFANRPVFALIPARGGSKGLPRKNLALVGGVPLLSRTINAALAASYIDEIVVSSEDKEILQLAHAAAVSTLIRPKEIAGDCASAVAVVEHFIDSLANDQRRDDPFVVYLQPTSPLRSAQHIDSAFELLGQVGSRTLVSVTELRKSPYKSFSLDSNGRLVSLFGESLSNERRQDLPPAFIPNGAIYIFAVSDFVARGGFPSDGAVPLVMSEEESVDIDTSEDIVQANRILGGIYG